MKELCEHSNESPDSIQARHFITNLAIIIKVCAIKLVMC